MNVADWNPRVLKNRHGSYWVERTSEVIDHSHHHAARMDIHYGGGQLSKNIR